MVNGSSAKDDRIAAALLHARLHGTDSEEVDAKIAALTERVTKALKVKVNDETKDELIAAAELICDALTDPDLERNRAAIAALIERLRKAQQLKKALEAHFQTAMSAPLQTLTPGQQEQNTSPKHISRWAFYIRWF